MFRLILQTQARLGGFSVPSHLLSPKVKSTLLNTNDLQCAMGTPHVLLQKQKVLLWWSSLAIDWLVYVGACDRSKAPLRHILVTLTGKRLTCHPIFVTGGPSILASCPPGSELLNEVRY